MPPLPVDVALLAARFSEKQLARLYAAAFDRDGLALETQRLGLNPLPGKRLKTMPPEDHALLLARTALSNEKQAKLTLSSLVLHLPTPDCAARPTHAEIATRLTGGSADSIATRLESFVIGLRDSAHFDALKTALDAGFLDLPVEVTSEPNAPPRDPELVKAEHRIAKLERDAESEREKALERERGLRARIELLRSEVTELQQRLGSKHREYEELAQRYEEAKGDNEMAFRRAARFKQALDEMKAPGDRERELQEALAREMRRAEIETSKVEFLEYDLDLLQHVEEEAPVRATTDELAPIRDRVLLFVAKIGARPRVLIVGGAGKQRAHRERDFELLKSKLEIEGEWRFADYGSWHRDLPRLRNDIQHRFDLVFVLHWNRTTFVQKMHDEARALNGRVRTVPYRGFLSLERAVAEEVDRFVQERI